MGGLWERLVEVDDGDAKLGRSPPIAGVGEMITTKYPSKYSSSIKTSSNMGSILFKSGILHKL